MKVVRLSIRDFRCFSEEVILPDGHVFVGGEPSAGRTTIIDALSRVLDPVAGQRDNCYAWDFRRLRDGSPIEIEVVLGGLDEATRQRFFDNLEVWDLREKLVIRGLASAEELDSDRLEWVLRIGYFAEWDEAAEQANTFTYYSKASSPEDRQFSRVRRPDLEQIPFVRLQSGSSPPLGLGTRHAFRRVAQLDRSDSFQEALLDYAQGLQSLADDLSRQIDLGSIASDVIEPIQELSQFSHLDLHKDLALVPASGLITGSLRGLAPMWHVADTDSRIPTRYQGSSFTALLRIMESLSLATATSGVFAMDDFGDELDQGAALHIAMLLRKLNGQAWIASRRQDLGRAFQSQEVLRLGRTSTGGTVVYQGRRPSSKAERSAQRRWLSEIHSSLSARGLLIVEGPHDLVALRQVALRRWEDGGIPIPEAHGLALVQASSDSGGGATVIPKLASYAKSFGLWTIALIDWDKSSADEILDRTRDAADTVVRLPERTAIERALIYNVPRKVIEDALHEVAEASGEPMGKDLGDLNDNEIEKFAIRYLKSTGGGLHALYVDALPVGTLPDLPVKILDEAVRALADGVKGLIQL